MKIKLTWITMALLLITIGGYVAPRWKYCFPSQASAWEPARPEQATPEATVNLMFQMIDQGGPADRLKEVMTDRLDYAHMLQGKDKMTPEEQKFSRLFLDNQRSAAIYAALRHNLVNSASITANNTTGDTAVIGASVKIYPDRSEDWTSSTCTIELKRRGDNWYVDDIKTPHVPDGIYHGFKQKLG